MRYRIFTRTYTHSFEIYDTLTGVTRVVWVGYIGVARPGVDHVAPIGPMNRIAV